MTDSHTILPAAEARYRAGDFAAAAALLAPLVAQVPPPSAALRVLGLCRLRLGAPMEALRLLRRALDLAPNDPFAKLHYGIGLQEVGQHRAAADLFMICHAMLPHDPAPLLNLSASLLGLGDVRGAVRAARRARLRSAAIAQTHYTLGAAYLAERSFSRAAICFAAAVRLAPEFADGWVNLGVAHYQDGRIEAAKQAMCAALAAVPDHPAASANLGAFLRLTGESEASETLLRGVIARRPDAPAARLNLAADLIEEGRAAEALAMLAHPVPSEPKMRQAWLLQQALALIKLGRLADAAAMIASLGPVPPALLPALQWRQILLAQARGDLAQAHRTANAMAATLRTAAPLLPEHRIMAHYDLARFWTNHNQPDQAFPHWQAGHRLLARFQPFSRADYAAFVDATIADFTAARFSQGARAANRDDSPVFVVGMPRSGTTLMEQILAAHPAVHGAGERPALALSCLDLGGHMENAAAIRRVAGLGAAALDAHADRYLHDLHALAPRASRIIDKMPANFRHLGLAALLLPGARVIACERDPRDIGLSIFTFRFFGAHGYAHDLADLGWYIAQQQRLMAHWRAVLPNPILTVRLRDWVEDFATTLRRVLDFLDLPYHAACEKFHEVPRQVRTVSRSQVQQPVNNRGLGRWRPYERHLAPLIAELNHPSQLLHFDLT